MVGALIASRLARRVSRVRTPLFTDDAATDLAYDNIRDAKDGPLYRTTLEPNAARVDSVYAGQRS
jgi:hypothetical protein